MWPFKRRPDVDRLLARRDLDGLVAALAWSEQAVVLAAVGALARLEGADVVPALAAALAGGSAFAARAIGARGDAAGVPALVAALGAEGSVAQEARAALVRLRALGPLREVLAVDPRPEARALALRALAELAPPDLDALLRRALSQDEPGLRRLAVQLGGKAEPGAPATSPEAMMALGSAGPAARPAVEHALQSSDPAMRRAALDALGSLITELGAGAGDRAALERAAQDPDSGVRRGAAGLLPLVGALGPLLPLLDDEDAAVRSAAAEALGRLGAPEAVPALRRALGRGEWAAARALGALGAREATPELVAALDDPRIGAVAAEALASLGDRSAIPAIEAFVGRCRTEPHPPGEPDEAEIARAALAKLRLSR